MHKECRKNQHLCNRFVLVIPDKNLLSKIQNGWLSEHLSCTAVCQDAAKALTHAAVLSLELPIGGKWAVTEI